jgi:hypothetical protein
MLTRPLSAECCYVGIDKAGIAIATSYEAKMVLADFLVYMAKTTFGSLVLILLGGLAIMRRKRFVFLAAPNGRKIPVFPLPTT